MSLTHPDHALVAVYGMRDSRRYDDVAEASRKAVELGATVVSRLEAPQLEAVFSDSIQASSFAIWLSRREVIYHTYQLTQVADPTTPPWPKQDAERVKATCAGWRAPTTRMPSDTASSPFRKRTPSWSPRRSSAHRCSP